MADVVDEVGAQRAHGVGADAATVDAGSRKMSMPAWRYIGSSASDHWIAPTTRSASTTTK